jgi:hypothetical protein
MLRTTEGRRRLRAALIGGALAILAAAPEAAAQSAVAPSALLASQAQTSAQTPPASPNKSEEVSGWPKISFASVAVLEYGGMKADSGPSRDAALALRLDSTFLLEFNDTLSVDGLFQFKPRQPLRQNDPNRELFINQAAGRDEGGRMKELYIRYGNYRVGKFVQDFGRAYVFLPGPFARDFVEEAEQGYEPADMIGVERIFIFENENAGWQQLSLSAFMVDRTFLHVSFPYNEGLIHYKNGGVGNTHWPENVMLTDDVINMPVGQWGQVTTQASVIRWGKTYGAQRGEFWSTLGADLSIPLHGSVGDTLSGRFSQLRLYVEGARRDNFAGVAGRARNFLSAAVEYRNGPWTLDLTTTQRRTYDRVAPLQKDQFYTGSIGYTLPSATILSVSVTHEKVGDREGFYAGITLTQTLTALSRWIGNGRYY